MSSFIYKIDHLLTILNLTNPGTQLTDANRILFSSTLFTVTAAVFWYILVQINKGAGSWGKFKDAITMEFVPEIHVLQERKSLRNIRQVKSMANCKPEFRIVVLIIPEKAYGEKFDNFFSRIKI